MKPGDPVNKFIRVTTAAGVAVTGLNLASFTVEAYYKAPGVAAATFTHASSITEMGSGWYLWTFTLPAVACEWAVRIARATGTDLVSPNRYDGETEGQDLDAIYAAVARPIVTLSGQGTIGQVTAVSLVAYRRRVLRFSFVDESGVAINMAAGTVYEAYAFSVRDPTDQTLTPPKFDGVHNTPAGFTIVGGSGYIDVTIPESASFFDAIDEGADVEDTHALRFELTGDVVGTSGQTVALVVSSPMTLLRREVGT